MEELGAGYCPWGHKDRPSSSYRPVDTTAYLVNRIEFLHLKKRMEIGSKDRFVCSSYSDVNSD